MLFACTQHTLIDMLELLLPATAEDGLKGRPISWATRIAVNQSTAILEREWYAVLSRPTCRHQVI